MAKLGGFCRLWPPRVAGIYRAPRLIPGAILGHSWCSDSRYDSTRATR
jgi:hypothetical protein